MKCCCEYSSQDNHHKRYYNKAMLDYLKKYGPPIFSYNLDRCNDCRGELLTCVYRHGTYCYQICLDDFLLPCNRSFLIGELWRADGQIYLGNKPTLQSTFCSNEKKEK